MKINNCSAIYGIKRQERMFHYFFIQGNLKKMKGKQTQLAHHVWSETISGNYDLKKCDSMISKVRQSVNSKKANLTI